MMKLIYLRIAILLPYLLQAFVIHAQNGSVFRPLAGSATGVTFVNRLIESPDQNIITYEYFYNGGGVAVADFTNDGLPDLYFTSNQQPNQLYVNEGNLRFRNVSRSSGTEGRKGWKTGVTVADVNADGWMDIYVCYSGDLEPALRKNQLFINQKNGRFEDEAESYGVADEGYSTQAAFLDYDRDGDLDLFVLNHNIRNLRNFDAAFVKKMVDPDAGDRLYQNDNGRFIDVTEKAGIISNPLGYGLGIAIADVNNDGWPDMYISNDYVEEDYLYINRQNGTFRECLKEQMGHLSNFSMGVDIADINNDGWQDIVTLDMLPEDNKRQKLLYAPDNYELYNNQLQNGFYHQLMRNMLQLNNGNGTFSEIGQFSGISNTDWSWAALLADFNNDGYKDLFVTNGYGRDMINRDFMKFYANERLKYLRGETNSRMFQMLQGIRSTPLHNYYFQNNRDLRFKDLSADNGFGKPDFSHGAVYSDLDRDGDLDLVVNRMNDTAGIYQNMTRDTDPDRPYLQVKLEMPGKNPQALGARVYIFASGERILLEQQAVHGFQSAMLGPLHTGLPTGVNPDSLHVFWPDGSWQRQTGSIAANQLLTVTYKRENTQPVFPVPKLRPLFLETPQALPFVHQESPVNDFKIQPLMTSMLSYAGPCMTSGDLNGDGLEDVFIGGAENQAGQVYLQQPDGGFQLSMQPALQADAAAEDLDAVWFDADGDKDADLYVVSGGYTLSPDDVLLQDRLYINEGGQLKRKELPREWHSGSCVVPWDYDDDGDLDLFVGGRVIPGQYPLSPGCSLLENTGKGVFRSLQDVPALKQLRLVTDAVVMEWKANGRSELIVCGEWDALHVLRYNGQRIEDVSGERFDQTLKGWWNKLTVADLDGDGDSDLVAGNWGKNSQWRADSANPVTLTYGDFDNNGFIDPILCYYIQGVSYPMASRDELTDQWVSLRQKFPTYDSYSEATIHEILDSTNLRQAIVLKADFFSTAWFENRDGKLFRRELPAEADFSPVHAIAVDDFNGDGNPDILLGGNQEHVRIRVGKLDASYGLLLSGDGRGGFKSTSSQVSGLAIRGDIREWLVIKGPQGQKKVIAGINNSATRVFQY